jgi:hypothetical protein
MQVSGSGARIPTHPAAKARSDLGRWMHEMLSMRDLVSRCLALSWLPVIGTDGGIKEEMGERREGGKGQGKPRVTSGLWAAGTRLLMSGFVVNGWEKSSYKMYPVRRCLVENGEILSSLVTSRGLVLDGSGLTKSEAPTERQRANKNGK